MGDRKFVILLLVLLALNSASAVTTFNDTFTEASTNTLLSAHIPTPTGTGWTLAARTGTPNANVLAASDNVQFAPNSAGNYLVYTANNPAHTADYNISMTTTTIGTSNIRTALILGRYIDTSNTYVVSLSNTASTCRLNVISGGVITNLATAATPVANGDVILFEITDTAKNVYKNGVLWMTSSNNAVTGIGKAGLGCGDLSDPSSTWSCDGSWRLDNFNLVEIYCGDGSCNGVETYATCAQDCCEIDCTGTADTTCHSACNGFNGCSGFVTGCDGFALNNLACYNTTYLRTCCTTLTACPANNYCVGSSCLSCSSTCDGVCQSSACYGIDPDCDVSGNPTLQCCGNNACTGTETVSNCPGDCCANDCTGTSDSICHSGCNGYNGCAFADGTAQNVCNNQASGSTVCYNVESAITCCEASSSVCPGCTDCSGGLCNVNDNSECLGTEANCYCSGTCQSCSAGNYCTAGYACNLCTNTCNGLCQDSSCTSDPDCTLTECCGNHVCAVGEACSADCLTETHCSDSVDNDQDGLIDMADPDCATCGDASCTAGETYSSCPADCCQSDGTSVSDTICHSVCTGYNGASVSSQCNSIDVSAGSGCAGTAGSCSASCAYTACLGTNGNCYCASGSCNSCSSNYYCTSTPVCTSCSTACNNLCQNSGCYGTDPDCDITGSATLACCGNSKCEGIAGESCSNCAADCGLCPTTTAGVCGNGLCEGNYNVTYSESCTNCITDCGSCPIITTATGVCGNGLCEVNYNSTYSESCTNCITDCGACSGTGLGYCGNKVCETGEDISNCPSDCNPSSITIQILSPQGGSTFLLSEVINLRIKVNYNENINGVNANVSVQTPIGNFQLTELGNGVYERNITVPLNASSIAWSLEVTARKGITGSASRSIIISNELKTTLDTDKASYIKNNKILLSGNVTNVRGELVNATVNITINNEIITAYSINGEYNITYQTNILDPSGEWLITAFALYNNNTGSNSTKINVFAPELGSYYVVSITSPSEGIIKRGRDLTITAEVTLNNINVSNATVNAVLPDNNYLALEEVSSGVYSNEYKVKFDDPLGVWRLEVLVSKDSMIGVGKINMDIKPAEIIIDVLSPTKSTYSTGEDLYISIKASYPDGSPVELSSINATIGGKELELKNIGSGIYANTYSISESETSIPLVISINDESNNTVSENFSINVTGKSALFYFKEYPYIAYPLIIGLVAGLIITLSVFVKKVNLASFENKKKNLINLKKKNQEAYYETRSISKDVYEDRDVRYENELQDLESMIKKLRKYKR